MSRPARSPLVAPLFVLVASAAFATSGPLARVARPEHPLAIAFGRVLLAGAILLLIDVRGAVSAVRGLTTAARNAVLLGGALLAVHFACFIWGLDETSLPAAIALVSLEPLSVVVAAWALHGDRPRRLEALGVVVATIGGFVVSRGAGSGEHRLFGDLLVIVAVVLYGGYVAVVRKTQGAIAARHAAPLVYLTAAACLLVGMLVAPARAGSVVWPPPRHAVLAIVALAAIPTLIGHTSIQIASRRLSPSVVALVSPGESVGGIAIAALWMHAWPSPTEAAGALVIVLGATIAIVGAQRP